MTRFAALLLAALALLPLGADAQTISGPPGASTIINTVAGQITPTSNAVCFVGDSITAATINGDNSAVTASAGTAPYTFGITGLPAGSSTTTSSPNLYFQTTTAAPGVYPITVTATDNVAATGTRTYNLTITNNYTPTLIATGASAGAVTLSDVLVVNLYNNNRGAGLWLPFLTNQRVVTSQALNFGLSGDTSTNILTRLAPVLAAPCGSYVAMIGTNDLNNTSTPSLATVKANISALWNQLLATGRPVFAMTILPRTLTVPANQLSMDMLWALNAWIRSQAGVIPGLHVVDSAPAYADPASATATPKTGATADYTYSYDGLHPKGVGAYAAWSPLATAYNLLYPDPGLTIASNADLYSAANLTGNLLPNGMMSFVGATGTIGGRYAGVAADGWAGGTVDAGCAPCTFTATGSAATLADGTPATQIVIAGTAGGGFATRAAISRSQVSFTNYSIGDKLQAACRYEMDAGSAHITAPFLLLTYSANGVAYSLGAGPTGALNPTVSDGSPATAYSGTLVTPLPAPPLPAVPSGTLQFVAGVYLTNVGSVTVAGTFRVGACSLRKVS